MDDDDDDDDDDNKLDSKLFTAYKFQWTGLRGGI